MKEAIPSNMSHKTPISIVVMTYNEEANIEKCLQSVHGWSDELIVVDSFSSDSTENIVRKYTNNFIQHAYESHPTQWNWALKNLQFQNQWVFALDADFRVSEALKEELSRIIPTLNKSIKGIYVRHRQIFRGRFIRHGTIYPRYWLRIFRPEAVFIDDNDLVDLHFYVNGDVIKVHHDLIEDNAKERELDFWVSKQLRFAKRAAVEELKRRKSIELTPVQSSLFGTPDQRTLWFKSRWYFLPLYWRSYLYFFYRYVIRLGFLDGKEGFLYHFTQALLYRLMVDVRIEELMKSEIEPKELQKYATALGPQTKGK